MSIAIVISVVGVLLGLIALALEVGSRKSLWDLKVYVRNFQPSLFADVKDWARAWREPLRAQVALLRTDLRAQDERWKKDLAAVVQENNAGLDAQFCATKAILDRLGLEIKYQGPQPEKFTVEKKPQP